jgi:FHA domain
MQHSFTALGFQDASDSSMWIIIGVVLVLLFFVVVIVVVGLAIFFVMRKRSKAQKAAAAAALPVSSQPAPEPISTYSQESAYAQEAAAAAPEIAAPLETPSPAWESPAPLEEIRSDVAEASPASAVDSASPDFDPSRTVAITRENTVTISYGYIKFVSGALSGRQFDVNPEGSYIGRESSLSQIVVPDPRISKRHMWIGVRDGLVRIVDQDSRNGTFVNDPKSERITEATLTSGDTVILGESDVARFEYHA